MDDPIYNNPEVDERAIKECLEWANGQYPWFKIVSKDNTTKDRIVDVYAYYEDPKSPVGKFWGIDVSHVHMSYKKQSRLHDQQQFCAFGRPAYLTMRAPNVYPSHYGCYAFSGPYFHQTMNWVYYENEPSVFQVLIGNIDRGMKSIQSDITTAYLALKDDEVMELNREWNEVLRVVQECMTKMMGGRPWSLGPE